MLKIAASAFLLYLVYCGLLFLLQRQIIYPRYMLGDVPSKAPESPKRETIWFDTDAGRVEAWFIAPENTKSPFPAVVFAHGNGELIDYWPDELDRFTKLGIGLMLVEYPGYGRSEGAPTQQRIEKVFVDAYDFLLSRKDVDSDRIVLFGRSLGGGAVCALVKRRPAAAMILMSSFTSVRSFAIRYLAPGFLIRDPFDNLSAVKSYNGPILFIHGKYDEIIPYKHGLALHQASRNGKMITYDSGHNDCPPDWNRFWQDIEAFLRGSHIL
ncbi:alpha/beta hydrolase [Thermodesulfobacteriota bacterium]